MSSNETRISHVGIAIPQDLKVLENIQLRAYLELAEIRGYDGLWVSEADAAQTLDPLSVLSFAAAVTTAPQLGTAVIMSARRNPMQLARDLASIDQLSAGRLIVGVGLGKSGRNYNNGLATERRVARFEAGIDLTQRLWTEDRTSVDSEWWQLEDVERPITTVQKAHPPIWFGARKPIALRRAAMIGDGWIGAGSSSRADFEDSLREMRLALAEVQRTEREFAIAKRIYVHVGPVTPSDRSEIEEWFGHHYGDRGMAARVAIVGSADDCIAHIRWLESLGVTKIILHPVVQPMCQMERLAQDVLPAVR